MIGLRRVHCVLLGVWDVGDGGVVGLLVARTGTAAIASVDGRVLVVVGDGVALAVVRVRVYVALAVAAGSAEALEEHFMRRKRRKRV